MQRIVEIFKSSFVPNGAAGYYGVNYDTLPQSFQRLREIVRATAEFRSMVK